jgi:hypothetical protein
VGQHQFCHDDRLSKLVDLVSLHYWEHEITMTFSKSWWGARGREQEVKIECVFPRTS